MEMWQITRAGKEYFCLSLGRDRLVESHPSISISASGQYFYVNYRKNGKVDGFDTCSFQWIVQISGTSDLF